jgi:hypothetical protein
MLRETYNPRKDIALILDRAFEIVESVPYQVSARWLFYRLLQEGYYSTKQDYANKFLKAVSNARHGAYKGWRPDTLADETRESIAGGNGWQDVTGWLEAVARAKCKLAKWYSQPVYLECWYEARAMTDQFRHYTKYVTLRPMGGQPSIPYKWQAAKDIEQAAQEYGKPVVILYFGDLDPAGETISEVIERDISHWSDEPFEFVRCGLTEEQVQRYNVPENIEHPGAYQWEALSDEGASDIITSNLDHYLHQHAIEEIEEEEEEATSWLSLKLSELADEWTDKEE